MTVDDLLESQLRALHRAAPADVVGRVTAALGLGERCAPWTSPIGEVVVCWTERGISAIAPEDLLEARTGRRPRRDPAGLPADVRAALEGWAAGRAGHVPVDLSAVRPFARAVLEKTAEIPFGEVRAYRWVAEAIGRPGAVRAVGTALARNPVPLVIPCHRVVRTDGRIGDYAFGTDAKRALLAREAVGAVKG